jgi:glutamate synthase domain-containing protein 3
MGMIGVDALAADDEAQLRALVEEHVTRTGSDLGKELLAFWAQARTSFVKVIPNEYKRILEQKTQAVAASDRGSSRRLTLVKGGG